MVRDEKLNIKSFIVACKLGGHRSEKLAGFS
jgi:hypothetical protein